MLSVCRVAQELRDESKHAVKRPPRLTHKLNQHLLLDGDKLRGSHAMIGRDLNGLNRS